MKKIIVFMLFVLVNEFSFGQILDKRNSWNVFNSVAIDRCRCYNSFNSNYSFSGKDTVIQNKKYSILLIDSIEIIGFLREDTLNKKVFFLQAKDTSMISEILLYDFNLKKGSVFHLIYKHYGYIYNNLDTSVGIFTDELFAGKVERIDTISYFGTKRRQISFINTFAQLTEFTIRDTIRWIDGIGSNEGLLYYFMGRGYLLCFKQNGEIKYQNGFNIDCNYKSIHTSVDDVKMDEVTIYPNPVYNKKIIIKSTHVMKSIKIVDCLGKLVYSNLPNNQFCLIDLINVPKGLYLVKVDNYVSKIIIE